MRYIESLDLLYKKMTDNRVYTKDILEKEKLEDELKKPLPLKKRTPEESERCKQLYKGIIWRK